MSADSLSLAVVKLRAVVPEHAFTAGILGSERIGNGIVIDSSGLILTIGYLIAEAADVWLTVSDGPERAGHALAYDQATGFGLVLPLQSLGVSPLRLGVSAGLAPGDKARVVSYPSFAPEQDVEVAARREFAGAWEYLLDSAIFTAPAHPHWSGAALLDEKGLLVGVGSLLVRENLPGGEANANMFVPIDLLKPILSDLTSKGRSERRPWLGVYSVEISGRIYVTGVAEGSPAQIADLREGDIISAVGNREVATLADFYRALWALGAAGVTVPLTTIRGASRISVHMASIDRADLLTRPPAH